MFPTARMTLYYDDIRSRCSMPAADIPEIGSNPAGLLLIGGVRSFLRQPRRNSRNLTINTAETHNSALNLLVTASRNGHLRQNRKHGAQPDEALPADWAAGFQRRYGCCATLRPTKGGIMSDSEYSPEAALAEQQIEGQYEAIENEENAIEERVADLNEEIAGNIRDG